MQIKNMFEKDINRSINGVIKVDQSDEAVLEQELDEYVITAELRKHFHAFFDYYSSAYDRPTADIGVWISGFFGSGKSHFLKMLSYLLQDKEVGGIHTSERFLTKVTDDPKLQQEIKRTATGHTDAILFNIDIEGPSDKTKTAVLRVFAKMFYNHLGFYGEDLKTARLEQFISQQGKWEEFQQVFEEVHGASWQESRDVFGFLEDDIVEVLERVLGMSEQSARDWFNGTEKAEISIAQLVKEIKSYVERKPDDYRLLFMADEVGQYIGTDTDMLLNFQSLTEKLGSECHGKVWVMATGQEALDQVVKVRQDEFSRIMARFKTRLSLSSSSVDEVIQRRILAKNAEAKGVLAKAFEENRASIDNLFMFQNATSDLKGFPSEEAFTANYPFVPYQFLLLQKVFYEVRKHGNTGKHLAGGERSMLSSFQEAAIAIQQQDERALAPFYRFYDTMRGFLDSSINRVIDRCEKAASKSEGLDPYDVAVLKCLYLICYVSDDLPGNADNIMILMADHIDIDKLLMRKKINESLDRLLKQHYINRTGDIFKFLTDEEQDIQRSIDTTDVDPSKITEKIGEIIYGEVYPVNKFSYDIYNFPFVRMVDDVTLGSAQGGMTVQFLTAASDKIDNELRLITDSKGRAIIVLSETSRYYELLEEAMRIEQFVNISLSKQQTSSVKGILAIQEDNAAKLKARVTGDIAEAIERGRFYVDGEKLTPRSGDAKNKINQALQYLVQHVYSNLDLITHHVDTNEDIAEILRGDSQLSMYTGKEENAAAANKMEEYLEIRLQQKLKTTMGDIQKRYQDIPYGWREIDIAAVMAMLIYHQKVTVKYAGETVRTKDPRLVDMLRKRTEIGRTVVKKHKLMSAQKINEAAAFLEDYLQCIDIPKDENGLVEFVLEHLNEKLRDYQGLLKRYGSFNDIKYPGKGTLNQAIGLIQRVLVKQTDNIALIDELLAVQDDFDEILDDLDNVEQFFESQADLFNEAFYFKKMMEQDMEYLQEKPETVQQIDKIRAILLVEPNCSYDYTRIPQLRGLIDTVRTAHSEMLQTVRQEDCEIINQCMENIHEAAGKVEYVKEQVEAANGYYLRQRQAIQEKATVIELKGVAQTLLDKQSSFVRGITDTIHNHEEKIKRAADNASGKPSPTKKPDKSPTPPQKPPKVKVVARQTTFMPTTLRSKADIDVYLDRARKKLEAQLANVDEIQLK